MSEKDAATKPYVVLARKYRPRHFGDLIGQEAMVRTLRNAFSTGRIAQAYMLTGVRGVGKTTTARILARALNYEPAESASPADSRPTVDLETLGKHCAEIMQSRHPDVIEMDAASNTGVDNVREIIESTRYRPTDARTKVFIIDEVHMLSKGAFNALLKTLEEPPEHVKFIFATTEIRKVPVTVLSRCQRFDLRRVEVDVLVAHFAGIVAEEGGTAEDEALALIARASEGSVRDGLSILDQALAVGSGTVSAANVRAMLGLADRTRVLALLDVTLKGDAAAALAQYDALFADGADPAQILSDLAEAAHLVARTKAAPDLKMAEVIGAEERERATAMASELSVPMIARVWQGLVKGIEDAQRAPDLKAAGEMLLIRLAYSAGLPGPEHLARMINAGATGSADATAAAGSVAGGPSSASSPRASGEQFRPDQPPVGNNSNVPLAHGPRSFSEVVALVGQRRDIRLKIALEETVRLVSFAPHAIEISLEPDAEPTIANDLGQKLKSWTGERWVVSVSRTRGGATLAEERRAREAEEIARVEADPIMQAMREYFPDAKIKDIKPLGPLTDDDAAESNGGTS